MSDPKPVCPVEGCSRVMDVERVPGASYGLFGGRRVAKPGRVHYTCPVHGAQKRPR